MIAPWPRILRARVVGARRDYDGDWRKPKSQRLHGGDVVLTLNNIGDRPLMSLRSLSPCTVARAYPLPEVHHVTVVRWWMSGRASRIEVVVAPIWQSPANFVGGLFVQYQAAPLCPCQRRNADRRATGECVCVVNGVLAPCGGVRGAA